MRLAKKVELTFFLLPVIRQQESMVLLTQAIILTFLISPSAVIFNVAQMVYKNSRQIYLIAI